MHSINQSHKRTPDLNPTYAVQSWWWDIGKLGVGPTGGNLQWLLYGAQQGTLHHPVSNLYAYLEVVNLSSTHQYICLSAWTFLFRNKLAIYPTSSLNMLIRSAIALLEYLPLSCSLVESPARALPEVHVSIAANSRSSSSNCLFSLAGPPKWSGFLVSSFCSTLKLNLNFMTWGGTGSSPQALPLPDDDKVAEN